jgi:hypothetical protein
MRGAHIHPNCRKRWVHHDRFCKFEPLIEIRHQMTVGANCSAHRLDRAQILICGCAA